MAIKVPMRGSQVKGRIPGNPWRAVSEYPVFEIFRLDYLRKATGYSVTYMRKLARREMPISDNFVEKIMEDTGWSVERLFGEEFEKAWEVDH